MDIQESQINQVILSKGPQNFLETQLKFKKQNNQIQQLWQVPICQKRQIQNIISKKQQTNNNQNIIKQVICLSSLLNQKQVYFPTKLQNLYSFQNQNEYNPYNQNNQNQIQKQLLAQKIIKFYDPYEAPFFDKKIQTQNKYENKREYFKQTKIKKYQQQKNFLNKQKQESNDNDFGLKSKLILSDWIKGNPNTQTNLLIAKYINQINSEKQIGYTNIKVNKVKYKVKPQPDDVFIIVKQKRSKKSQKQSSNDLEQTIQIKNQKKNKKYQKILIKNGRKIYVYKEKYYYPKNQCKTKDQIQFENSDLFLCQFQMRAEVENLTFNMPYEEWKQKKIIDLENRKIL